MRVEPHKLLIGISTLGLSNRDQVLVPTVVARELKLAAAVAALKPVTLSRSCLSVACCSALCKYG